MHKYNVYYKLGRHDEEVCLGVFSGVDENRACEQAYHKNGKQGSAINYYGCLA